MGFYGSDDPTNSVKALKEAVVLRIGFDPTRFISPCYNTTHAYNVHTVIHNTKMNLRTVKWAQWDKTQSRELLGLFDFTKKYIREHVVVASHSRRSDLLRQPDDLLSSYCSHAQRHQHTTDISTINDDNYSYNTTICKNLRMVVLYE